MPSRQLFMDGVSHMNSTTTNNGIEKSVPNALQKATRAEDINGSQPVPSIKEEIVEKPDNIKVETGRVQETGGNQHPSDTKTQQTDAFTDLFGDAANEDEKAHLLSRKITKAQWVQGAKRLFNQDKDEDRLDVRAKQAVLHLTWTDMRIKEMEREIKLLRSDVDKLPPDFEVRKKNKWPVFDHRLKRSPLSEFRLNDESKSVPEEQRPALEVLVSDHTVPRISAVESPVTPRNVNARFTPLDSSEADVAFQVPERLRIRSRPLLQLLARISGVELLSVSYTRNIETPAPVVFLRPFKLFVTYEKEIRDQVQVLEVKIEKEAKTAQSLQQTGTSKKDLPDFDSADLLKDLNLLIEFLDIDLNPTFELRNSIKDGTAQQIEYQDLWHLFNIGDIIVDPTEELQVYRVLSYTGGREILIDKVDNGEKPVALDGFMVDCYNLHTNGYLFGPKLHTLTIRRFRGIQPIANLPFYPLRFDPSYASVKQTLLAQGQQFLNVTNAPYAHKMLIGKTLDEPVEEIDAQVIVDMTLAINKNPEWNPELKIIERDLTVPDKRETHIPLFCPHHPKFSEGCCGSDVACKDNEWDEARFNMYFRDHRQALGKRKSHELSEEDKMLLPSWAYGFVLRSRRWVTLRIADLSEVKYESTFDDLVLPQERKDTLEALVQDHARSSTQNSTATSKVGAAMDLVRGKGKGLIILLHGEPGVGKTSTAECVADLTQRPLFPVTCGDIGESAFEVQSSLDYNFQLAHKWGCVLLLDEADVFLSKRSKKDLRRNAVVSVFLRTLEYYSGILFLTTNRVGSIDPAFKSRIHMSLLYSALDRKTTLTLYKVFIKRTKAEQNNSTREEFKLERKEIMEFAKDHFKRLKEAGLSTWNGRQIRNAFQTAIALAEYDARQPGAGTVYLGKKQFETIAEASQGFDEYLRDTLGALDADLARREELRSDDYEVRKAAKASSNSKRWVRPQKRYARDPESESDVTSDDSTDDDSDDSDDNDEDEDEEEKKGPKKVASSSSTKAAKARRAKFELSEDDDEDNRKILKNKEKKKAKK